MIQFILPLADDKGRDHAAAGTDVGKLGERKPREGRADFTIEE